LGGTEVGQLHKAGGRARLTYGDAWRRDRRATALSLSLPLVAAEHDVKPVEAFLWGLLPDNDQIIERWARAFHVSPRNAYAMISHVGEDCAGAVQFVRPERMAAMTASAPVEIQWLTEAEIAQRLRGLRQDQAAWRMAGDLGQFSLAGAQPKTALLHMEGRWGIPSGRTPTTHILKPPLAAYQGHVENEHFCLMLAKTLGLPAAGSSVVRFGDETAIVVERYDRAVTARLAASAAAEAAAHAAAADPVRAATLAAEAAARATALGELAKTQPVLRLHQEDLCQALGLLPVFKYQNEGGPSPADIVRLLRMYSSRPATDVGSFVAALAFNWLIAGPDAHAKNYSLLHGSGGRVRLAPLYDLASVLPYDSFDLRRVKLAMKIGGSHQLDDIGARQWRAFAAEIAVEEAAVLDSVTSLAEALPAAIADVLSGVKAEGLEHPILDLLAVRLTERAAHCLALLRL